MLLFHVRHIVQNACECIIMSCPGALLCMPIPYIYIFMSTRIVAKVDTCKILNVCIDFQKKDTFGFFKYLHFYANLGIVVVMYNLDVFLGFNRLITLDLYSLIIKLNNFNFLYGVSMTP